MKGLKFMSSESQKERRKSVVQEKIFEESWPKSLPMWQKTQTYRFKKLSESPKDKLKELLIRHIIINLLKITKETQRY